MPRLEFWFTDTQAIDWTFDRVPEVGDQVVLGDRGVFEVTGNRPDRGSPGVTALACERVRDPTPDEIRRQLRAVNVLQNALVSDERA